MAKEGGSRLGARWKLISIAVILVAFIVSILAVTFAARRPTTDDASIDADVVHIAPSVGGRIVEIAVTENERVEKGQLLFQIDAVPYRLAVDQAKADLSIATAQLETQRRILSTQRSNATVAADQTRTAEANFELATRTVERLRPLAAKGYIPKQQLDQAEVAARDAATALSQSQEHQSAAQAAIDTEEGAAALVRARQSALALAERQLEDTTVRAPHDGLVVGLTVSSGEFVAPGQSLFTMINTEEWFAIGNFKETDLRSIEPGDCATVYAMTDRRAPIGGIVQGIGWGVLGEGRVNLPRSVPYVERSLNWVRVAQRFPVRVRLEDPPQGLMRLGASAVIEVKHGAECR
ncbi:MAG: multidrug transporter subunit MdtN [Alphaproteobacteria bacterium]|nr:multidrug transporter subunit MdtN [Alphaproteobacteria bacterium]